MTPARTTPRTLAEAFGPYTSHQLQPMPQPPSKAERVYRAMAAFVAALVAVLLIAHHLAQ